MAARKEREEDDRADFALNINNQHLAMGATVRTLQSQATYDKYREEQGNVVEFQGRVAARVSEKHRAGREERSLASHNARRIVHDDDDELDEEEPNSDDNEFIDDEHQPGYRRYSDNEDADDEDMTESSPRFQHFNTRTTDIDVSSYFLGGEFDCSINQDAFGQPQTSVEQPSSFIGTPSAFTSSSLPELPNNLGGGAQVQFMTPDDFVNLHSFVSEDSSLPEQLPDNQLTPEVYQRAAKRPRYNYQY